MKFVRALLKKFLLSSIFSSCFAQLKKEFYSNAVEYSMELIAIVCTDF